MVEATSFYKSMINTYPLLGIDKHEKNLHNYPGVKAPDWINNSPLYEVYIRCFSEKGDIAGVVDKLPYLKKMGVQTIWLMPIYPIGERNKKGEMGCPYSVRDYYKINPEYGTMNEMKNLILEAHELDMKIIVDLVANHVSNDYIEMEHRDEMFSRDKDGRYTRKITDWYDVTDLNYDQQLTHEYMGRVAKYWLEDVGFDGYRCDVAGLVPIEFWERTVRKIGKSKPNIFMLAEWEGPRHHINAFHSTYDWILYFILKDIKAGKRLAEDALKWVEAKKQLYPQRALPLRFIENHDMPRAIRVFGINGVRPFAAFIFSIYGIPLIYAGQEHGEFDAPSLFDKSSLNWDQPNKGVFKFYKKLIQLRKQNPAFSSKNLSMINNNRLKEVMSYIKTEEQQQVLCLLNFSNQKIVAEIELDNHMADCLFRNMINGEEVSIQNNQVELKPYQVIFINR